MRWTRRSFITTSAGAALVTHIQPAAAAPAPLDPKFQDRLRAIMDEIIPRQGSMPSATEAGAVAYFAALKQAEPAFAAQVLAAFEKVSTSAPPLDALKQLEKDDPANFALLRDFVYEAYYTQPQIWKLIDYQFHPTDHKGPRMKPFDESVIANVRTKPKFYREA